LSARPIALLFDKFGMTKLKATTFAIRGDGPTN
jgi:polar amino acid transport system substrate-binding protein